MLGKDRKDIKAYNMVETFLTNVKKGQKKQKHFVKLKIICNFAAELKQRNINKNKHNTLCI